MTNIFINRNRSQGVYGSSKHYRSKNLSQQKQPKVHHINNDTEYKWLNRAKLKSDDFYKQSLKFGSNLDLQPDKVPGAAWALIDSSKVIQQGNEVDFVANTYDKGRQRAKPNSEVQQWRTFNNFEKRDMQYEQKGMLKDEINNIAMRIVNAREARENMDVSIDCSKPVGTWKVADIEPADRSFKEGSRYFDVFPEQRRFGKMHCQPPVLAATLYQLREDQKFHDTKQQTFKKQANDTQSLKTQPPQDIVSLLSNHDGRYVNGRGPALSQTPVPNHKRAAAGSESGHARQGASKSGSRAKESKADVESMKLAKRMLKFSQAKGGFQFPKRERFNEEVDEEIQSIMSDQKQRLNSSHVLKKKFLKHDLGGGTSTASYNPSSRASRSFRSKRTRGSKASGLAQSAIASRMSSNKVLSKADLEKYFAKGKVKPGASNRDDGSTNEAVTTAMSVDAKQRVFKKRGSTVGRASKSNGFIRKMDCANPRYAASKAPSQVGLLVGQKTRPNGFAEPTDSEMALFFRDEADGELDAGVEEAPEELHGEGASRLDAAVLRTLGGLNEGSDAGSDGAIEEMTYHDYEHETVDGRTIFTEGNYDEGQAGSSISGVAGGKVGTWGTGAQGGLKLCFQTPSEKIAHYKKYNGTANTLTHDDRLTVATSDALSNLSAAPTSLISQECARLQEKLRKQKQNRAFFQKQIERLQATVKSNQAYLQLQQNGDHEQKILLTDQRNQMYSAENYMRHPQVEDF